MNSSRNGQFVRNISTNVPSQIRATQALFAEPLKKKKRLDPAIIRAREERKKRRLKNRYGNWKKALGN